MLWKQKFLRFKLFMWHPLSLHSLSSVCMWVAPAIAFLGLSPCEGDMCLCERALPPLIGAKLEYISPAEEITEYSLIGSNTEVKINALSSFSEPKIACECFSCDNFRKWGDSFFLPLFNIFDEFCA